MGWHFYWEDTQNAMDVATATVDAGKTKSVSDDIPNFFAGDPTDHDYAALKLQVLKPGGGGFLVHKIYYWNKSGVANPKEDVDLLAGAF